MGLGSTVGERLACGCVSEDQVRVAGVATALATEPGREIGTSVNVAPNR